MACCCLIPFVFVCAVFALRKWRQIWEVEDIPTVSPSGAMIGVTEVRGKAAVMGYYEGAPSFVSPVTGTECVWYDVKVEVFKKDEKTWVQYGHDSYKGPFRVRDEYGSVVVDPQKAKKLIDYSVFNSQDVEHISRAQDFLASQSNTSNWNDYKVRVTEKIIPVDAEVFVHGLFVMPQETAELIADSTIKGSHVFVSTKGEESVEKKLKTTRALLTGSFIALLAVCVVSFLLTFSSDSDSGLVINGKDVVFGPRLVFIILLVVAGIFAGHLLFLKLLRTFNRFVSFRERISAMRSTINVTAKRRYDLIPQLCSIVEGATESEKYAQETVAQLRARSDTPLAADLAALVENYPNLKTAENFTYLFRELSRTEEKISMARSYLNDTVMGMDNLRATLIGRLFSPFFGKEQYWQG